MTPISSTKQTPFTCLGIRKIFVCHEIWQSASLLGRRLLEYLIFIRQSKGEDGRLILYLWMLHDSQYSGYSEYTIMAPKFTFRVEFPGPSNAKVVYSWDWRVVINKWLLKLTTCKSEWDKSSQDFCWSKKKGSAQCAKAFGTDCLSEIVIDCLTGWYSDWLSDWQTDWMNKWQKGRWK